MKICTMALKEGAHSRKAASQYGVTFVALRIIEKDLRNLQGYCMDCEASNFPALH